jgi:integrase
MPNKLPYCVHRSDRPGYWFDRRVPADCQAILGRKHWRVFAGTTVTEARRRIAQLLADTDSLIAQARSGRPVYVPASTLSQELEERLLQGRPEVVQEYREHHIPLPDRVEDLLDLEPIGSAETILAEDLVALATRIKRPSQQTIEAWWRVLNEFNSVIKVDRFNLVTKQDCQKYRDYLLDKGLKASTVKLRLNYLSGLLRLAHEEGLLTSNAAEGLTKRLRADRKTEKTFDLIQADAKALNLPEHQYLAYMMLRYSGCRLAEVLGLRSEDIDPVRMILTIRPYEDRPLKTQQSERQVPIHPCLRSVCLRLVEMGERPFLEFKKGNRWGAGITWGRQLGVHPHGLRHSFATALRENGIQELIISKLLGHTPSGQTSSYGSVPFDKLVEAVNTIT